MNTNRVPENLFEFSSTIRRLNSEKKFDQALEYFREFYNKYSKESISNNNYLVNAVLHALRHSGKCDSAFQFMEMFKIKISDSTDSYVLQTYAWLLYDKFKAVFKHDETVVQDDVFLDPDFESDPDESDLPEDEKTEEPLLNEIAKTINLLSNITSPYAYTPMSVLWNTVLKVEKKKPKPNWFFVLKWCDLVTIEQLSDNCNTIKVKRKGVLKDMELACDKENWFAYKTKALFKLNRFDECYELSKQALETITNFHYSNDIWLARRIALSKKKTGKHIEAIQELETILKRKKDWFIQRELAELYFEKGDNDRALKLGNEAILNHGDLPFKVDLLILLAEMHDKAGNKDLAFKHLSLCRLVRLKQGWNIPLKLSQALNKFGQPTISEEKFNTLLTELKTAWNPSDNSTDEISQIHVGSISKILNNNEKGTNGFILYENKKEVYFKLKPNDKIRPYINVGVKVEFKYIPASHDRKDIAVQLRIIKA